MPPGEHKRRRSRADCLPIVAHGVQLQRAIDGVEGGHIEQPGQLGAIPDRMHGEAGDQAGRGGEEIVAGHRFRRGRKAMGPRLGMARRRHGIERAGPRREEAWAQRFWQARFGAAGEPGGGAEDAAPVQTLDRQHHAADRFPVIGADRIGAVGKAEFLIAGADGEDHIGAAAGALGRVGHVIAHQPAGEHAAIDADLHGNDRQGAIDPAIGTAMHQPAEGRDHRRDCRKSSPRNRRGNRAIGRCRGAGRRGRTDRRRRRISAGVIGGNGAPRGGTAGNGVHAGFQSWCERRARRRCGRGFGPPARR